MMEKDFIKREIDQLGVALRKILSEIVGLKNSGNANQNIETSESTLKNELDIDIEKLKDFSKKALIHFLTKEKKLNLNNLNTLAEILMEISNKNKNPKTAQTTLRLFEYLEQSESTYSLERQQKIKTLKQIINPT